MQPKGMFWSQGLLGHAESCNISQVLSCGQARGSEAACSMEAGLDDPPETCSLLALTCAGEREAAHERRLQSY